MHNYLKRIFIMQNVSNDELYTLIKDSYNSSVVVDEFCSNYQEIEEISNITPIIHYIRQKLDLAYAVLIDNFSKDIQLK